MEPITRGPDADNTPPAMAIDVLADGGVGPVEFDSSTGETRLLIEIIPVTDESPTLSEDVVDPNNVYVSLGEDTNGNLYPLLFDHRYPNQNQLWVDVYIEP